MTYPTPNKEGHFWARLVRPNQPAGEDWAAQDWEPVTVFDNNGEGNEAWGVFVPGIDRTQWLDAFEWGPEIVKPADLK